MQNADKVRLIEAAGETVVATAIELRSLLESLVATYRNTGNEMTLDIAVETIRQAIVAIDTATGGAAKKAIREKCPELVAEFFGEPVA